MREWDTPPEPSPSAQAPRSSRRLRSVWRLIALAHLHYFSHNSPILRNGLLLNTFEQELKTTNIILVRCDTSVRTYLLTYLLGYPPR